MPDVLNDLQEEYEAFDATLEGLHPDDWGHPTLCSGWDVRDLVCHLWIQAEVTVASIEGDSTFLPSSVEELADLDRRIDESVRARRDRAAEAWEGWRDRRAEVLRSLRGLGDDVRVRWTVGTMAPRTLATTLLMETWTHAYDVRHPLGLPQEVTPGLRHVAWFAWKTLPFAFTQQGEDYAPVRFVLEAPDGETWTYGSENVADVVRGSAMELCLRAVRRLDLEDAQTLDAEGDAAVTALRVMRCFP